MFKFFRKYNKFILAVGAALLMVAFLIQGTVSMFMGNPADRSVGKIDGESVSFTDLNRSAFELDILRSMVGGLSRTDSLSWFLMKHEAHLLGISASSNEAEQAMDQFDETQLARFARGRRMAVEMIRQMMREWIAVYRYRELMYGRLRISGPLLERFVHDLQAKVRIVAIAIGSNRYLEQVKPPQDGQLQGLFDEYKDTAPGEGELYGLGYRYPDRVKIEYLEIPAQPLKAKVENQVKESDAVAHFETNVDQYRQADSGTGIEKTVPGVLYKQVRSRILTKLRKKAAGELGHEVMKAAHLRLIDHRNKSKLKKDSSNYYMLEEVEEFQPLSFEELAEQLQKQFGILPTVRRDDGRWRSPENIGKLDGIGRSHRLDGTETVVHYVQSVRELNPPARNNLVVLRLQKGIVSKPMVLDGPEGPSFYLFRVTDADPAHSPASIDEVRDLVLRDAQRLAAYQLLLADRARWLKQAREGSFELMARQLDTDILRPPPFSRREQSPFSPPGVPEVAGIGRNERFVQRVFDLAERIADQGGVDAVSPTERIDTVGVDHEQRLFIVRVDKYAPIKRSEYDRLAINPLTSAQIGAWISSNTPRDPLSLDMLKRRVRFVAAIDDTTTSGPAAP